MISDNASILPLAVSGLSFEVEGRRLIDSLDLVLPGGGITALVGPNGAGKSLLLRLCHGLIEPTDGRISWVAAPGRKRHAMVFQHPVMLRRSARANIVHGLAATGAEAAAAKADAALARFGLQGLADQPARLLSGGEQQRLAIARAWALQPELLFLDEPTSQLDPGAIRQIETLVRGLAEEGMTILMATHDLGQARRLASRVIVMHRGRIIDDGPAARVFAEPATAETRAFIAGDLLW